VTTIHRFFGLGDAFSLLRPETASLLLSRWADTKGGKSRSLTSKWDVVAQAVSEITGEPKVRGSAIETFWRNWKKENPSPAWTKVPSDKT
jgi:hypothetical protein